MLGLFAFVPLTERAHELEAGGIDVAVRRREELSSGDDAPPPIDTVVRGAVSSGGIEMFERSAAVAERANELYGIP